MWKCKKCGREFGKKNQSHSCKPYPLSRHFEKKKEAKLLFDALVARLQKTVGPFKTDSVSCCIHLTNPSTFCAVFPMKDRIRVDFALDRCVKSSRLTEPFSMSANRLLYFADVKSAGEIDKELLGWIKEAYALKK